MILCCLLSFNLTQRVGDDDSVTPALFLILFVVVPIVSIRAYYYLKSGRSLPPREKRYKGVILGQLVLLFPAIASAKRQGLALWPSNFPNVTQWLVAVLILSLLCLWVRWRWSHDERSASERLRFLLPRSPGQLGWWIVVSVVAGIGEEYVYRGVAYSAISSLAGGSSSALICSVAFGAAHLHSGLRAGLWTLISGLVLQLLVFWTGALYLSMFVHTAYDLFIGIAGMQLMRNQLATQGGL
jgi:membrane protease YdiL (CAAX protease family)